MKLTRWALLAAVLAFGLGCARAPAPRRSKFVERLPRVEVVQPERKRIVRRLETSAIVEAQKKVDLSARVPGVVTYLDDRTDIGQAVKKDEVLVKLDVPDLDAERDVKKALEEQARKQESLAVTALTVAQRE